LRADFYLTKSSRFDHLPGIPDSKHISG
jgi:hypothetical protein